MFGEYYDRNPCYRALIRPEMLVIPQTHHSDKGTNHEILLHGYNAKLYMGVIPKLSLGRLLLAVQAECGYVGTGIEEIIFRSGII